jgi:hypothetical protein
MLDIGEQQFLMLLFVVQAQLDQVKKLGARIIGQQIHHRRVHSLAKGKHLLQRRAGYQSAMRARVHRPDRLIVGVEQEMPGRVTWFVRGIAAEHEMLEEPRRVREMPFAGTGIRHRLYQEILGAQASNQGDCRPPNPIEARRDRCRNQKTFANHGNHPSL